MSSVPMQGHALTQDDVLQRQQEQYAAYVRQHQSRSNSVSGGPSRLRVSPASPNNNNQPAPFDERLLEASSASEYHLADEGDPVMYHPDGRTLRGRAAVKARAALWVSQHVAWTERSCQSTMVLIFMLAFCLFIGIWLTAVGSQHLGDDFRDPNASPTDPNPKENLCSQLPYFLIGTGVMFMVATVICITLMILSALNAKEALETSVMRADLRPDLRRCCDRDLIMLLFLLVVQLFLHLLTLTRRSLISLSCLVGRRSSLDVHHES